MGELRRRPRAREDVVAHFEYIGYSNLPAAERFLQSVERAYARLLEFPGLGAPIRHRSRHLRNVRQWPVPGFENYLIFYRSMDDSVEIIRVLHGARDIGAVLRAETESDA